MFDRYFYRGDRSCFTPSDPIEEAKKREKAKKEKEAAKGRNNTESKDNNSDDKKQASPPVSPRTLLAEEKSREPIEEETKSPRP